MLQNQHVGCWCPSEPLGLPVAGWVGRALAEALEGALLAEALAPLAEALALAVALVRERSRY